MNYLAYILIGVVGFVLGRQSKQSFTPKQSKELAEMREESHEALTERTEKRKEKILEFMKSEAVHQEELKICNIPPQVSSEQAGNPIERSKVTCEDIEKLLEVSGQTARKYLNELESENKIRQIGENGPNVYYILNV